MFKKEGFPANKEEMLMTSAMMTFVRHAKNVEIGAKRRRLLLNLRVEDKGKGKGKVKEEDNVIFNIDKVLKKEDISYLQREGFMM